LTIAQVALLHESFRPIDYGTTERVGTEAVDLRLRRVDNEVWLDVLRRDGVVETRLES
jgi:hypothetical protein